MIFAIYVFLKISPLLIESRLHSPNTAAGNKRTQGSLSFKFWFSRHFQVSQLECLGGQGHHSNFTISFLIIGQVLEVVLSVSLYEGDAWEAGDVKYTREVKQSAKKDEGQQKGSRAARVA